jgi:hypothetical protein
LSESESNSKEKFHLQQDVENLRKEIEILKISHTKGGIL